MEAKKFSDCRCFVDKFSVPIVSPVYPEISDPDITIGQARVPLLLRSKKPITMPHMPDRVPAAENAGQSK